MKKKIVIFALYAGAIWLERRERYPVSLADRLADPGARS